MRVLRIPKRAVLALAILGMLLTVLAVATPQGRTAAKTGGFVFQVLPAIPVKPLEWFTASPIKEEVFFPQSQGEGVADLYSVQAGDRDGSPTYNAREEIVRKSVLAHGKILAGPSRWQTRPGYMLFQGRRSATNTGYPAR